MDGVSAAASVIGIATAGVQISIKLITFSNQVGTAPSRIRLIGNDVSLTSGVLQQLGDLMHQQNGNQDDEITIFSEGGVRTTQASATTCKGIFEQLEEALKKASRQIRESGAGLETRKVVLSKTERLRFPFLQPNLDSLRGELRDARGTLLLILQVTTLAYSKKLAELNRPTILSQEEQTELMRSILAMHRKKANADTEDDGENHEDDEKNEEEVKAHDGPLDEGVNVSVIPPYEAPIITPPVPGETDTAGAILTPDLEAEREGPDLSNDDQKAETSDPKDSSKTSLSNSPIHDSAIKRPPVCRFPWSSDGKDAGRSRLRSRDRARRRFSRRGRGRSSSSSTRSIIRLRSRSLDDPPDIVKEAWIVSPSVQPQKSAFRLYWFAERLPLKSEDVEEAHERLMRKSKKSIMDQMIQLTDKEREFIDEWFNDELAKQQVRLYVVAVALEKIKSSDVVLPNLAKRRIRLIIERHPLEDSSRSSRPRRRVHRGPGVIDLNRPTFIKVDRKYVEPDVLDNANLPWEWDQNDSRFMVIKKWLPEPETDRLFKETRKLREKDGGIRIHEENSDKFMALARPTYIKVHRKYVVPKVLDEANLPWEHDSDYIIIKKYIPEQEQEQLFEKSRKFRERRGNFRKVIEDSSSKSKWRPVLNLVRKKHGLGTADEDPKLDRITIPVEYRPERPHSRSRSRSSSVIDVEVERRLGELTALKREGGEEEAKRRFEEEKVLEEASIKKEIRALEKEKRALQREAQKKGRERKAKARDETVEGTRLRKASVFDRTASSSEEGPGTPPVGEESMRKESYITPTPYHLTSPVAAAPEALIDDLTVSSGDAEEAQEGENGQDIIDGLLGKYTTLFDQPQTTAGGLEEKSKDGDTQQD